MSSKSDIKKYAAQSAFVFTGKVIKTKAATMQPLAASNTIIAEVVHIINAPPMFTSVNGQQITVRFKKMPSLKAGQLITVFANGWVFGDSIAVDAVGYSEETGKSTAAAKTAMAGKSAMSVMVENAVTDNKDAILKERIDSAEMSVVGEVTKVKKSDMEPTHISEHNPLWQEATIKVDEVVKGKKGTKEVKVMFPASDDVRWKKINKYSEGQKGIWMIQKGKKQAAKGIAAKVFAAIPAGSNVFTTLHQSDFMPLNELSRIKSLIKK